jgi:hypothetical protein
MGLPEMTVPAHKKKPPTKDGFFRLAAYGRDGKITAGATVIRWWAVQGSNL